MKSGTNKNSIFGLGNTTDERGSAMVIALLVMMLLAAFVALAISRTNSETIAASNDASETKAYEAANASLEILTRNFNKVFEVKLTIDSTDITRIQGQYPPVFDADYTFQQTVTQTQVTKDVVMTGEMFQGLNARRDEWQLDATATDKQNGVQVALRRKFLNNRIPIFQFGIFYDDDLEFHPGPRFDFGGRVHSNGSLFMQANDGLYFSSKVSAANHVFTDVSKNGSPWTNWDDEVYIKNASGSYVQLTSLRGSVLNTVVNGSAVTSAPLPTAYNSASWTANQNLFQGNLLANTTPLQLPIKINGDLTLQNLNNVEIIRRGKRIGDLANDGTGTVSSPSITPIVAANSDDKITAAERVSQQDRYPILDRRHKGKAGRLCGGGRRSGHHPLRHPHGWRCGRPERSSHVLGGHGYGATSRGRCRELRHIPQHGSTASVSTPIRVSSGSRSRRSSSIRRRSSTTRRTLLKISLHSA